MRLSAEVDLRQVADDTHGYAGADLGQLVTEAAMQCVREKAGHIDVDAEDVDPELLDTLMVRCASLRPRPSLVPTRGAHRASGACIRRYIGASAESTTFLTRRPRRK